MENHTQLDPDNLSESDLELDEEDLDHFINELRRIIHEYPPGHQMQARFARTISYLQQKKRLLKERELIKWDNGGQVEEDLNKILSEIQDRAYSLGKFKTLLKIAQNREKKKESNDSN